MCTEIIADVAVCEGPESLEARNKADVPMTFHLLGNQLSTSGQEKEVELHI